MMMVLGGGCEPSCWGPAFLKTHLLERTAVDRVRDLVIGVVGNTVEKVVAKLRHFHLSFFRCELFLSGVTIIN